MNNTPAVLVLLCLFPALLLAGMMLPGDGNERQRPPGTDEIAGLRLVLYPFSMQVSLARIQSESGNGVEFVWAMEMHRASAGAAWATCPGRTIAGQGQRPNGPRAHGQ